VGRTLRAAAGSSVLYPGDRMTQLANVRCGPHVSIMSSDRTYTSTTTTPRGSRPRPAAARGPVIDQDGREVGADPFGPQSGGFDFGGSQANPFANLTREQRIARIEALAKLLDVAFIVPGTNIRYGIDGIIGLIPVLGDIITTAISLWLVREARAIGAPWHITARMLGNVALDGVVGIVPVVGDAFDVMFRANIRNVRMLRKWLDKQPR
jgi:hypothetical protein